MRLGVQSSASAFRNLDDQLLRFSRFDVLARIVLGHIAGEMLRRRVHKDLGFIRLGDYANERLGFCAGEMRALGRVASALAKLPELEAAVARGTLNWTKLRTVASVAQQDSQAMWLALATALTAEALRSLAKKSRNAETLAKLTSAYANGLDAAVLAAATGLLDPRQVTADFLNIDADDDPDPDTIDGEPVGVFRLRCPRGVLSLWRRAVELASRVAGQELKTWQAVEAIAAEGLSAAPADTLAQTASSIRADTPCGPVATMALSGLPKHLGCATSPRPIGRELPCRVTLPHEMTRLARNLEGQRGAELDRRARLVVAAMQSVESQIGRRLGIVAATKSYARLGYPTLALYATNRLGLCLRKARALLALDRRTHSAAPQFIAAYGRGQISSAQALVLLPIVCETNAASWIARAQRVTLRRLKAEVEWAQERLESLPPGLILFPPPEDADLATVQIGDADETVRSPADDSTDGPLCSVTIVFRAPLSVVGLFDLAIDAFAAACEPRWMALDRLVGRVVAHWESLPRHRDPIFERDGWRCTVPACTSRRNLHDHHVIFRSHGGGNDRLNRTTVCAGHHQHHIHMGVLRAERVAKDTISWWLGVDEGLNGGAFLRLLGDRYVEPQPLAAAEWMELGIGVTGFRYADATEEPGAVASAA